MTFELQNKINPKLDLLTFQKNLNDKFLEIFEEKKNGQSTTLIETSKLGLGDTSLNYRFFFPLNELKNISSESKFESLALTQSWIAGFNQVRGDVFTIIDFQRVLEYIISNQITKSLRKLNLDSNTLYLKEQSKAKIALIIDSLSLEHTSQFLPLFIYNRGIENNNWSLVNEKLFEEIITNGITTTDEINILNELKNISVIEFSDLEIDEKIKQSTNNKKLLWVLISDVFIDKITKKPVFVVDIQRLTKFLMSVSPF